MMLPSLCCVVRGRYQSTAGKRCCCCSHSCLPPCHLLSTIGGGSYWAGRAIARPLFGLCGPPLSLARPLFWWCKTFSSYILPLWLVKIFSNEQEMRTKHAQNATNGQDPLAGFRGETRDRPTHFLAASAAYAIDGTRRTDMAVTGH